MPPKIKRVSGLVESKSASSALGPVVIYWHRTDLRLHDSPALHAALSLEPKAFIPVWTWDPHYVFQLRSGPNRWQFLLDCQRDISESYRKVNSKQKLHVIREAPQTIFPKLFKKWNVTHLVFEKDTDAYPRMRDDAVTKIAKDAGVEVIIRPGRTLFDSDELVKANGGKPTMSIGQVQKACEKINKGNPNKPLPAPQNLPDPLPEKDMDISDLQHELPNDHASKDLNQMSRSGSTEVMKHYTDIMGPKRDFVPPTLEEMGIDSLAATTPHRGGETIALRMLAGYVKDESCTGTFEKPASSPAAFEPQSTTLLSPHLHFGSLSVRKFWWDVQEVIENRKRAKQHVSSMPVNLPGQLLFRDMYFGAQAALGKDFHVAKGNKVVRWVDWHLLSVGDGEKEVNGERGYIVDDPQAEEWYLRWKEGRTGFPWIDALMRQLKQEGWIHHLGRHAVACFLTRGGCYVSWERGAEVFEEWLLDHEPACNAGNWMWLSCTAFFSQFYRCYSPIAFGRKWDPEGEFVRKYVPELKHYSKKYIYEPWKAPNVDQKQWGCLIKGDGTEAHGEESVKLYPKPMFSFDERRQTCIDGMKNAYNKKLYGNDEKVMNGKWKELFDFDDKGAKVHDLYDGMAERPKKKRKVDEHDQAEGVEMNDVMAEDEDAAGQADEGGEEFEAEKKEEKEEEQAKGGAGRRGGKSKQATLDAHIGRKRGKR